MVDSLDLVARPQLRFLEKFNFLTINNWQRTYGGSQEHEHGFPMGSPHCQTCFMCGDTQGKLECWLQ
jgi:hypothetical protein